EVQRQPGDRHWLSVRSHLHVTRPGRLRPATGTLVRLRRRQQRVRFRVAARPACNHAVLRLLHLALPLRMTSVDGSNKLRSLSSLCVLPRKMRALVCFITCRTREEEMRQDRAKLIDVEPVAIEDGADKE